MEVRTVVNKRGGHLGAPGSVSFNFEEAGVLVFKSDMSRDEIEELLIMGDVDVTEVTKEDDGYVEVHVTPTALNDAKNCLNENGITEFETYEIQMLPNDFVDPTGEDREKMQSMLDMLDELQDVQAVWHNMK